jgi:hypothetical protein
LYRKKHLLKNTYRLVFRNVIMDSLDEPVFSGFKQ